MVEIFIPLAGMLRPGHHGVLRTQEVIHEGATLRELLIQLSNDKYQPLLDIAYDAQTDTLTKDVQLIVNNTGIGVKPLGDIQLNNEDSVAFLGFLAGG